MPEKELENAAMAVATWVRENEGDLMTALYYYEVGNSHPEQLQNELRAVLDRWRRAGDALMASIGPEDRGIGSPRTADAGGGSQA